MEIREISVTKTRMLGRPDDELAAGFCQAKTLCWKSKVPLGQTSEADIARRLSWKYQRKAQLPAALEPVALT
jgi:hypothetical protein